jgi:hypothetical protein
MPTLRKAPTPIVIGEKINTLLASKNTRLRLIGAKWNTNGNLVLTFPYGSNPQEIARYTDNIRTALAIPDHISIGEDLHWSKVVISNVPTGAYNPNGKRFSGEELLNELHYNNPVAKFLTVTQLPRWITKTENNSKHHSSFVFSFVDPLGMHAKNLINTPLFMFSTSVHAHVWVERPLIKNCTRCLGLDHFVGTCRRRPTCDHCGGTHASADHKGACNACRASSKNGPCPHPKRCANCQGPHGANDDSCPKRALYRKPVTAILNRAGPSTTHDAHA